MPDGKPAQQGALISPRRTRQRSKMLKSHALTAVEASSSKDDTAQSPSHIDLSVSAETHDISYEELAGIPTASVTRLRRKDHQLLLRKQDLLRKYEILISRDFRVHSASVDATLVFAQEEAGTAVCIAPEGLLLTCSHCVAETVADLDYDRTHWLVFATGRVVGAKCVTWDSQRDLALLKVVSAYDMDGDIRGNDTSRAVVQDTNRAFPFVKLLDVPPPLNARLVCIGHPGSEDLEANEPGVKTNYDVLHLSTGAFRGYAEGQDLQDNSEIGALMHDCWTYWGHSGAPLLDRRSGRLIGLHSSWDDKTAMRRGVPLEAIQAFLESCNLLEKGKADRDPTA